MAITFQDYVETLQSGIYQPIIRIDWLRDDETVYSTITASIENGSGNLSVQRQNGQRRSLDFSIINLDGLYIPSPDGIWLRQKFKLYLGLRINEEDFFLSQGVFVLENPTTTSNFSESFVQIKALDKFSLLDGTLGGEIDSTFIAPIFTPIYDVIRDILITYVKDPIAPVLYSGWVAETLPYTLIKEIGNGTFGDILIELADMMSAYIYYDEEGRLNFVPGNVLDNTRASEWDFTTDEVNYGGSTYNQEFNKVFNACLIIGDNVNGGTIEYKIQNNNLLSNTSIPNVGFERIKVINDSLINTIPLAQQRGEYELRQIVRISASINLTTIPMYHLTPDGVVTLTDVRNLNLNKKRFLINGFSIPLKIGSTMTIDAIDTAELSFSGV